MWPVIHEIIHSSGPLRKLVRETLMKFVLSKRTFPRTPLCLRLRTGWTVLPSFTVKSRGSSLRGAEHRRDDKGTETRVKRHGVLALTTRSVDA